jgi:hypothetical protein
MQRRLLSPAAATMGVPTWAFEAAPRAPGSTHTGRRISEVCYFVFFPRRASVIDSSARIPKRGRRQVRRRQLPLVCAARSLSSFDVRLLSIVARIPEQIPVFFHQNPQILHPVGNDPHMPAKCIPPRQFPDATATTTTRLAHASEVFPFVFHLRPRGGDCNRCFRLKSRREEDDKYAEATAFGECGQVPPFFQQTTCLLRLAGVASGACCQSFPGCC